MKDSPPASMRKESRYDEHENSAEDIPEVHDPSSHWGGSSIDSIQMLSGCCYIRQVVLPLPTRSTAITLRPVGGTQVTSTIDKSAGDRSNASITFGGQVDIFPRLRPGAVGEPMWNDWPTQYWRSSIAKTRMCTLASIAHPSRSVAAAPVKSWEVVFLPFDKTSSVTVSRTGTSLGP